jgi:hypothetical protein
LAILGDHQFMRSAGIGSAGLNHPHDFVRKATVMKKIFSLLMVAVAICGFTLGCSEGGGDSAPETAAPATEDPGAADTTPAEEAPGETEEAPAAPAES